VRILRQPNNVIKVCHQCLHKTIHYHFSANQFN